MGDERGKIHIHLLKFQSFGRTRNKKFKTISILNWKEVLRKFYKPTNWSFSVCFDLLKDSSVTLTDSLQDLLVESITLVNRHCHVSVIDLKQNIAVINIIIIIIIII